MLHDHSSNLFTLPFLLSIELHAPAVLRSGLISISYAIYSFTLKFLSLIAESIHTFLQVIILSFLSMLLSFSFLPSFLPSFVFILIYSLLVVTPLLFIRDAILKFLALFIPNSFLPSFLPSCISLFDCSF